LLNNYFDGCNSGGKTTILRKQLICRPKGAGLTSGVASTVRVRGEAKRNGDYGRQGIGFRKIERITLGAGKEGSLRAVEYGEGCTSES